jgi:hypothetical protein
MIIAEVDFRDVESLVRLAFPGARSRRTVKIDQRQSYHVSDYWDGGSRDECRFIKLATRQVISAQEVPALTEGHIYKLAFGDVELSPGFIVVEHCIFCGKDLGYRIYCSQPWPLETHVETKLGQSPEVPRLDGPAYVGPNPGYGSNG